MNDHAAQPPQRGTRAQTSADVHPRELAVATGDFDDHRAPVEAVHKLYEPALRAWREQDRWTDSEHELFWTGLLPSWPRSKAPGSADREERAWVAHLLHDGHGATIEHVAEALGYARDTAQRLVRDGRQLAHPGNGRPAVRVPRVFEAGTEERPRPPYVSPFEPRPTFFHWDHPEPRAYGWTDEQGNKMVVLPLVNSPWVPVE